MPEAKEIADFVLAQLEVLIENDDPEIGFEYGGADPKEGAELALEYALAGSKHRHVLRDKGELYTEVLGIVAAAYPKQNPTRT